MHSSDKDHIGNSYNIFVQAIINNLEKIRWVRIWVKGLKLLWRIIVAAERTGRDCWQDERWPNDFLSEPYWDRKSKECSQFCDFFSNTTC